MIRCRRLAFALGIVLLAGIVVWASFGLAVQLQDSVEQDQIFNRLRKTTQAKVIDDISNPDSDSPTEGQVISNTDVGHDIAKLQEENPDCIGWISIDGTNIDYPVMQTVDDPEFYLKHNFDGDYNNHGVPFLDARCSLGSADNLIVYGHHMNDGSMFSSLHKYAKYSYFEDHPLITLETMAGIAQYKVAAVMRVSGTVYATQWSIFDCIYMNDVEFAEMVNNISKESLYDTGVTPVYGDKLLTLSTCEYTRKNGRLVVLAVKQ